MSDIPTRLKHARLAAGLKQDDLAQKMEAGRPSISRWETGKETPSMHVLASWGYATGHNPEWLRTGEGPERIQGVRESSAYRVDPPLDSERLRSVIELVEDFLATLKPSERPSPTRIAGMILKFYEIEVEAAAPIPLMRERILPFIQALRVG